MRMCEICGDREAVHTHHLIFGYGVRYLCDVDGITMGVCMKCHETIHNDGVASSMSKMLGQMMWEKKYSKGDEESTRDAFRQRYGRSWL